MYYHTCPLCGANLDPGERCDCRETSRKSKKVENRKLNTNEKGASVGSRCAGIKPDKNIKFRTFIS